MEPIYIKYVALYLRKSRGDVDSDLNKHRNILIKMCQENNWKYIEYKEIVSGDSIIMRPIFTQLLKDVESGLFDAVCVVDIDRLGRGDLGDQDKIKKAFAKSNTYVVTPQQIYNLNNDDDEFVVDMKGFIARREYKQIVKRFIQGKKVGARLGMWTNGKPPYPYEYQRYKNKYNEKGLVVNDEKLPIYRFMVDSLINYHLTPNQIAVELNKRNIPSPKNSIWYGLTVYRILIDETHLGKIISNKHKGDGHAKRKPNALKETAIPKEQWTIVENCHEAVKTEKEHEQILLFLHRVTNMPKRQAKRILPLTGLIKCGICGHTMGIYRREDRHHIEYLKPCWYKDYIGNKCPNQGMITDKIYPYLFDQIMTYKNSLEKEINNADMNEFQNEIKIKLSNQQELYNNKKKALSRIQDAFENGVYSLNQFKERKEKIEKAIEEINKNIQILQIQYKQFNKETLHDKVKKLDNFFNVIQNPMTNAQQQNKIYKSIIESIVWTKRDNNISIHINFK